MGRCKWKRPQKAVSRGSWREWGGSRVFIMRASPHQQMHLMRGKPCLLKFLFDRKFTTLQNSALAIRLGLSCPEHLHWEWGNASSFPDSASSQNGDSGCDLRGLEIRCRSPNTAASCIGGLWSPHTRGHPFSFGFQVAFSFAPFFSLFHLTALWCLLSVFLMSHWICLPVPLPRVEMYHLRCAHCVPQTSLNWFETPLFTQSW